MAHIGLISDTHVPHRMAALPDALFDELAGVDLILHAGDLDDPRILDELRRIAPVKAVRGNWHLLAPWPNDQHLPVVRDLGIDGQRILLTHGHLSVWRTFTEKRWLLAPGHRQRANRHLVRRLANAFPGVDAYLFGHSHRALIERHDGALFVNPGSVCTSRGEVGSLARLTVTPEGVEAELVAL